MADNRRNSLSSDVSSGYNTPARRLSASDISEGELFPLELQVGVTNLPPNCNPIVGLFSIDNTTGALVFLSHTEVKRCSGSCIFDKRMFCNYYSGRHQKLQVNVYAVNWSDDGVDNAICEEDRIGSVIIQLDKITALQSQINFVPVNLELPLWHDTDNNINTRLTQMKSCLKVQFRAQDGVDIGPRTGPQIKQMTLQEAIHMMEKGCVFKKYPYSSNSAPSKRFVFYDRTAGDLGSLYWCQVGKRKKDKNKCIPITSISGLFEQNQTPAFKRNQRRLSKTSVDKLFSIVSKKRTLDLECSTTDIRDAFMFGIHKILTSKGFGILEQSAADAANGNHLRNIFVIQNKVRNLPVMPWTVDESNDTLVGLFERQGSQFVYIEQTEWVKGNSMPNFRTPLLLPFMLPLQPNVVRFNVYDHSFDDEHLIGSAVVRLDFFQKYAGQEMLVKLRNPHSQEIDQMLQENNTYMLLTAFIKQDTGRSADDLAVRDPNAKIPETKEQYQSILEEFHAQMRKGPGGNSSGGIGGVGRKITAAFTRSTLAFMGAGETFTLFPPKASPGTLELCEKLSNSQKPLSVTVYFRPQAPFGTLIFTTENSGDVDGMDKNGNPKDPFLILPIEKLFDCKPAISENTTNDWAKKDAKANCTFHIEVKESAESEVDTPAFSFELEARNSGVRDAWQAGISEFILYVIESDSPLEDDDENDPLAFIDGTKRKAVHLARKQARIAGKSNVWDDEEGEGEEGEGGEGTGTGKGGKKGGKGKGLDGDAAAALESIFPEDGKDKKKEDELDLSIFDDVKKAAAADLPPPIMGEDGVPCAPPMFGDCVVGGDGVPAPPPMAPGMGAPVPVYNGPKLKKLHWEVMDGSVEGTLWALIKGQMDEEGGALLEELFKMADAKSLKKPEEDKNAVKRILDSKRAQNVEILLKNFRMPYEAICEAILGMDMTILTQERLQMLLTICPNADEMKSVKDWIKKGGNVEKLGNAEQFALKLDSVPRCQMRLRLLLFQSKFDGLVEDMVNTYSRLLKAGIRVKSSDKLKNVMQVVLSVGNHLNRGTRAGQAQGFRLASLDKLTDTRSTDNKLTLLDFIVEHVNKTSNKIEEKMEEESKEEKKEETKPVVKGEREPPPSFLLELQEPLKDAALIDWAALNVERETLLAGLDELQRELKSLEAEAADESKDKFKPVMSAFLTHASTRVEKLKQKYNEVQTVSVKLIAYFGENTESMELTEFFKIFDRFINSYKQAEINQFNRKEAERKKKLAAASKEKLAATKKNSIKQDDALVDPNNPFGAKLRKSSMDKGKLEEKKADAETAEANANPFGAKLRKTSNADAKPAAAELKEELKEQGTATTAEAAQIVDPAQAN
jgi:hypothetical protein